MELVSLCVSCPITPASHLHGTDLSSPPDFGGRLVVLITSAANRTPALQDSELLELHVMQNREVCVTGGTFTPTANVTRVNGLCAMLLDCGIGPGRPCPAFRLSNNGPWDGRGWCGRPPSNLQASSVTILLLCVLRRCCALSVKPRGGHPCIIKCRPALITRALDPRTGKDGCTSPRRRAGREEALYFFFQGLSLCKNNVSLT